jgi:hypothetical protein
MSKERDTLMAARIDGGLEKGRGRGHRVNPEKVKEMDIEKN